MTFLANLAVGLVSEVRRGLVLQNPFLALAAVAIPLLIISIIFREAPGVSLTCAFGRGTALVGLGAVVALALLGRRGVS